jgi:hypothetical protein
MFAHLLQIFLVSLEFLNLPIDSVGLPSFIVVSAVELYLVLTIFFDFTHNVFEEMLCSEFKILIRVYIISVRVPYFSETVHVELADEGSEIAVFEV